MLDHAPRRVPCTPPRPHPARRESARRRHHHHLTIRIVTLCRRQRSCSIHPRCIGLAAAGETGLDVGQMVLDPVQITLHAPYGATRPAVAEAAAVAQRGADVRHVQIQFDGPDGPDTEAAATAAAGPGPGSGLI